MELTQWLMWIQERIISADACGNYELAEELRLQMELCEEGLNSPTLTIS